MGRKERQTMKKQRKKPYTQIGISRLKCIRCENNASFQWNICADGNVYRPLCAECDVELNEMVMRWAFGNEAEKSVENYRIKVLGG